MPLYSKASKVCFTLRGLALLSLALRPPLARACSKVPPGLRESSATVPVDGVIVLLFGCDSADACTVDNLPEITVHDGPRSAAALAGGLVRRELVKDRFQRWALWRPQTPFVAGRTYTLSAAGEFSMDRTFTAVATDSFDPKTINPSLALDITEGEGPLVCCPATESYASCLGKTTACFYTERKQNVGLTVTPFRLTQSLEQWVYRTTFRVGDKSTTTAESPLQQPFYYSDTLADEYCFSLAAVHVVTGQLVNVGADCKKLVATELITVPVPQWERDLGLIDCVSPPAGYEQEWQAAAGRLSTQGAGSDAGADAQAAADAGADADVAAPSDDHGCGIAGSSSGPSIFALLLVLVPGRLRRGRCQGGDAGAVRKPSAACAV